MVMVIIVFFMQKNMFLAGIFVKSYKYTVFTGVYLQIHPGSFLASMLNSGARRNMRGPGVFCSKQKVTGWRNETTFTIDSYTCHEHKYNFSYSLEFHVFLLKKSEKWI